MLLPLVEDDPFARAQVGAFVTALQQAGWTDGRNARIEIRWAGPTPSDIRRHAAELVTLGPEVVLAYGASTVGPLLQNSRTVPIVFPVIGDPVAAGFVETLARPGGNVTGFMMYEYSMAAKWLELLKEMVPALKRVARAAQCQYAYWPSPVRRHPGRVSVLEGRCCHNPQCVRSEQIWPPELPFQIGPNRTKKRSWRTRSEKRMQVRLSPEILADPGGQSERDPSSMSSRLPCCWPISRNTAPR